MIDISIIIPAKNGAGLIGETLKRVFEQKISQNLEVIVIDSGSIDGTLEIIKTFPQIRLIQIKPEGFGHGRTRNLGAREASGKYLVFLNQDVWPANENWLVSLIQNLESDPKVAAVYSRQLPRPNCSLRLKGEIERIYPSYKIIQSKIDIEEAKKTKYDFFKNKIRKINNFSTVSCAIKKELWEQQPFNDDIRYAEDQEWSKRMLELGHMIIYDPESMVYHSHDDTFRSLFMRHRISVKTFNRILGRKTTNIFLVMPYIVYSFFFDNLSTIVYILKQKVSTWNKIKEIYVGIMDNLAISLGKASAMLDERPGK